MDTGYRRTDWHLREVSGHPHPCRQAPLPPSAASPGQIRPEPPPSGWYPPSSEGPTDISEGIRNLKDKVSLEEMGAYRRAAVTAQDPQLLAMAEAWNRYATMEVTYQFGDAREVGIDGAVFKGDFWGIGESIPLRQQSELSHREAR